MIKLIEELYNSNEISEEVKNRLLDKHFNREMPPGTYTIKDGTLEFEDEEALEERMKIIGQNGNTGEHYDYDWTHNVREEALRKEKEYYSKLRGDSSGTID